MTYDKPEIRDFGNIAEHTYAPDGDILYKCVSGPNCVDVDDVRL
jgi:hypothetical protein